MTIKDLIKNTVLRFPLAILSGFTLIILCIYADIAVGIPTGRMNNIAILKNVLTVGVFLFIFIALLNNFLQTIFNKPYYKFLTNFIGIIVLIGIYYFARYSYDMRYQGMFFFDLFIMEKKFDHTLMGLLLFSIGGSLFIEKVNNSKGLDIYIFKVIRAFGVSMIFSVATFIISNLIVYTLATLFFSSIDYRVYSSVFYIVMIGINLLVFLSNYPKSDVYEDYTIPRFFKTLLTNVIMPLISIYGLILYIYFVMILIQRKILVRQIAYLVVVYGVLTVGMLFLLSLTKDSKFKKLYMKIAPISIIPLLGMLFYSMGTRIKNYGITENRYYVILLGIWLLISAIYIIKDKYKNNIPILVVFAIFALIGTTGPVSGYNMSSRSQSKRLEYYLEKNNMLEDGKLIPAKEISEKDKEELVNLFQYFEFNKEKSDLNFDIKIKDDFYENIEKYLGFEFVGSPNYEEYSITYEKYDLKVDDISNYSKLEKISFFSYEEKVENFNFKVNEEELTIKYNDTEQKILLTDLEEKVKMAEETGEYLILDLDFNGIEVRMYINSLLIYTYDSNINIEAMAFIK